MDVYLQLADEINNGINTILGDALSGKNKKYLYKESYIRWGLVEKDINEHVIKCLMGDPPKGGTE